jgi:competence protein ComGC
LFVIPVLIVLAVPAMAAEKDAPAKAGAPGTNIDMPFLMAPPEGCRR